MSGPDRLAALRAQDKVTGLDFVAVSADQLHLAVYFHRDPTTLQTPLPDPFPPDAVRIRAVSPRAAVRDVAVTAATWDVIAGRPVLRLTCACRGDFCDYLLTLADPRIDRFYNGIRFSFQATCPADVDCTPRPAVCPPPEAEDWPTPTLARDFWSFRQALLDFAAARHPEWVDRLEADAGMMLVEVLSAFADEMAYYQDRAAREAHVATARERRSVRKHLRLVDYELDDGASGTTWLDVTVTAGEAVTLLAGTPVSATDADGNAVVYEVGTGLDATLAGVGYALHGDRTTFAPHLFDEDDTCLPAGATEIVLVGHHAATLFPAGITSRWMLLRSTPADRARPARAWRIRAVGAVEELDAVLGTALTRVTWDPAQALPFDLDLTETELRGNLVPATAGVTVRRRVVVGAEEGAAAPVEREGPEGRTVVLVGLAGTDEAPLARLVDPAVKPALLPPGLPRPTVPEVRVFTVDGDALEPWEWRRSLVAPTPADEAERVFTLEDGLWDEVVGWDRAAGRVVHRDYRTGLGHTVRFGDGVFGRPPPDGTTLEIVYRLGGGTGGNLPEGALTSIDRASATFPIPAAVGGVTNPLPVVDGRDPESAATARALAPEAMRAVSLRAVRAEEHATALERLPFTSHASARLRWTGSWLTVFAALDPKDRTDLPEAERRLAQEQLDRVRMAGREAWVVEPAYAPLDVEVLVCVAPGEARAEVRARVEDALLGPGGFFDPDAFTFGTPLWRSALEARVQAVPGVRAVRRLRIARRGHFALRPFVEARYQPGPHEVLEFAHDPLDPGRGTLRVLTEGGA